MTKVALRAYNHEIESMIEQGQRLDEAVAHCRHILTTYPKHLDTYRLLGKAYLEAKRHDQAVDIFQRVLVAAPDDFVAHVGMSIIADDQGKLDEAIWHMERAFEVQPSNAAIQAELQRLFGRRDGREPPKIRLTRGALAHMYVQGDLHTQAISEIRAVLANDPERMDMQVLLARAYFHNGQKAESADVCSALLTISPYCVDANKLMAEILPGTQATEAAQEYRRRVLELDPYAEFAKGSLFAMDSVADASVTLLRLEYTGQVTDASAVAASGLASVVRTGRAAETAPSWLSQGVKKEAGAEVAAVRGQDEDQALDQDQNEDLPDFLRGSGWREVPEATADEASVVERPSESDAVTESEAVPGDLPEWVRALAPTEDQGPSASSSVSQPASETPAFEMGSPRPSPRSDGGGLDETPDWLRELDTGAAPFRDGAMRPREENPASKAAGPAVARGGPVEDDHGLAWLEGLAEKHGAKPEELITPRTARTENPPEWVANLGQDEAAAPEGWVPVEQGNRGPSPSTIGAVKEQPSAAAGSAPDWLSGLADADAFAEMEKPIEDNQAALVGDSTVSVSPTPASDGALPDWLADESKEPIAESPASSREPSGEYVASTDLPDWLVEPDVSKESSGAVDGIAPKAAEWFQPETEPPASTQDATQWRSGEAPGPSQEKPASPPAEPNPTRRPEVASPLSAQAALPGREALPARTRASPQPAAINAPSLEAAKAELARGNIAAALEMYGRLIRKGKSLDGIIRELREALYRYPVEVPIWQALGDAYMRANRLQEALDAYTKAEELLR